MNRRYCLLKLQYLRLVHFVSLIAPLYTRKALRLTRQEGKATPVYEGEERIQDLVGI
jgi:hypothetical protein